VWRKGLYICADPHSKLEYYIHILSKAFHILLLSWRLHNIHRWHISSNQLIVVFLKIAICFDQIFIIRRNKTLSWFYLYMYVRVSKWGLLFDERGAGLST
jgi:hypothetical protein